MVPMSVGNSPLDMRIDIVTNALATGPVALVRMFGQYLQEPLALLLLGTCVVTSAFVVWRNRRRSLTSLVHFERRMTEHLDEIKRQDSRTGF